MANAKEREGRMEYWNNGILGGGGLSLPSIPVRF
jgi:hypothetical protein